MKTTKSAEPLWIDGQTSKFSRDFMVGTWYWYPPERGGRRGGKFVSVRARRICCPVRGTTNHHRSIPIIFYYGPLYCCWCAANGTMAKTLCSALEVDIGSKQNKLVVPREREREREREKEDRQRERITNPVRVFNPEPTPWWFVGETEQTNNGKGGVQ